MPDYTPTFADLCSAIADGEVIATLDGSVYEVNAFELRRYFSKPRILTGISSLPPQPLSEGGDPEHSQNRPPLQRH